MGLETGSFIATLVATNPVGATDPKSQGDDHIRLIKKALQNSFPRISTTVEATPAELNFVVGATQGLATLSISLASAIASISAINTLVSQMATLSASVTSSDITGSIRTPVLQTQAGFTAGTFTAATVTVNNKGIITKVTSGSAGSTITAGTPLVQNPYTVNTTTGPTAHGLSVQPKWYRVYLECLSADLNYTAGDIVECGVHGPSQAAAYTAWTIVADATNLTIITNAAVGYVLIMDKTTRAATAVTATKWKLTVVPYTFA